MKIALGVSGMKCGGCAAGVKKELIKNPCWYFEGLPDGEAFLVRLLLV
jgi:hypothetical protein